MRFINDDLLLAAALKEQQTEESRVLQQQIVLRLSRTFAATLLLPILHALGTRLLKLARSEYPSGVFSPSEHLQRYLQRSTSKTFHEQNLS